MGYRGRCGRPEKSEGASDVWSRKFQMVGLADANTLKWEKILHCWGKIRRAIW